MQLSWSDPAGSGRFTLSYLNASFCRSIPQGERLLSLDEYAKGNFLREGRKEELASKIRNST